VFEWNLGATNPCDILVRSEKRFGFGHYIGKLEAITFMHLHANLFPPVVSFGESITGAVKADMEFVFVRETERAAEAARRFAGELVESKMNR
jgi:hypothetical protein